MSVQHTPPEEVLVDYAAGSLPEPVAVLVASHLALAPESRAEVRRLEALGGALLEEIEPEPLSDRAVEAALGRLDEVRSEREEHRGKEETSAAGTTCDPTIPGPLRQYVDRPVDALSWKARGRHVREYELHCGDGRYRARLLRIRAGSRVPSHTHEGAEYTLVLQGSFHDETGRYARGDVSVADDEITHTPVAGAERDCICLVVTDAPLRMTGPIGRLLNYFVDI